MKGQAVHLHGKHEVLVVVEDDNGLLKNHLLRGSPTVAARLVAHEQAASTQRSELERVIGDGRKKLQASTAKSAPAKLAALEESAITSAAELEASIAADRATIDDEAFAAAEAELAALAEVKP